MFDDFAKALIATRPDVVSINIYPDTHETYTVQAHEFGCHVFLEKTVADTEKGCRRVIQAAKDAQRKLVAGYILHRHPLWIRFVEAAKRWGNR